VVHPEGNMHRNQQSPGKLAQILPLQALEFNQMFKETGFTNKKVKTALVNL
jgi:hypothetical protein